MVSVLFYRFLTIREKFYNILGQVLPVASAKGKSLHFSREEGDKCPKTVNNGNMQPQVLSRLTVVKGK